MYKYCPICNIVTFAIESGVHKCSNCGFVVWSKDFIAFPDNEKNTYDDDGVIV